MATLGLDTSEYEQGIEQAQKETQSAANSLNRSANTAGSGVSGMASQFAAASAKATVLANMLTSLGTKAVSFAKGFVEMGISYNAQIEKYTTGFTNMLGSAQAAQEAMQAIQEDAARTPFDVASLTQANQLLISAGENAAYSRKVINALGDAVSATGGGNAELSRMAANLQQIANVGKAATIDIKQFAYAGINIYQILADYTGKSVQEVQKMTISYDLLSQALIAASEEGGRYYNAMDTQSQTMNGRISTLKDNVSQLAGLMTGDLSSGIGVVIGHLNDMVVAAQEAYKEDGWKGLGNAILELDNPISAIIKKFGQLGSAAVSALDKASYYLNKALGKNAYAGYDNYDDYKSDKQKQSNRDRLRQNALSGKSVSNKSWSERQAEAAAASGSGGSSIVTSPSSSSGKSTGAKSKTETVIASVTHTATTTAQNALGAVTTSVETLQEKVKDAAGKIKDRVTETTTETGKEMVNGVATTYTLVTKKVTDTNGKISTTTKKVYADMSKTLLGTLTTIAEKTFNGITTTTQQAVETYADGSQHIKTTATETGERIVDGVRQTYTKIISYVDGVQDKVTETAQNIDKSIKATQKRIEENLSKAQQQFNSGIFKLGKNLYTDLKNQDLAALGLDIVNMMWGEVSQEQREVLSDWANKALEAINEAYSGGGLSEAFNAFKQIMSNGIKADANGVTTDVKGLSKVFQDLGINVSDVGSKIMGVLNTIGSGMGSFALNAGTDIANLAGSMGSLGTIAEGVGGLIAKVGSLIISNPEVAAIIAIVAGVAALGVAIFAKFGKGKSSGTTSTQKAPSYKDIQDAYWYGNERAFAGYDYRTDPYVMNPDNNAMLAYQSKMQAQMERLYGVVEKYLPEAGNSVIALDGEQVGRIITPSVNRSLGDLTVLSERGN
ncbi:tape measure protein [Faecalibacterium prausnitzii]|jgi:tape measure domain-containing protein|nr:tape measure protein [Faecalibacterium prausnitzii]DAJ24714.1 MAG TPA: tail tape measure protein [Caudoviricetes sp.]DAS09978.1 MAG TPA: tail tape measure protein [Caudoviricetes sp.]